MGFAPKPRVSVCIPTRDRADCLGRAIESALTQSIEGLELIVLDDGSRDETPELLASVRDPRLRCLSHRRPLGVAASRNRLLAEARGEYVAWLDSDDAYEPDALSRLAAFLEGRPDVSLAHGAHGVIDAHGDPLPDWPAPFEADAVETSGSAFGELVLENYIAAPTVMVRREAHERAGAYAEELERGEDWDMWMRLALQGSVAYVASRLAVYRYHDDSLSGGARRAGDVLDDARRVIDRLFAAERDRIPGAGRHERRARTALAARALLALGDAYTRGAEARALDAVRFFEREAPDLDAGGLAELRGAIGAGDDYVVHQVSRELLAALVEPLAGTRFGDRIARLVDVDADWSKTLLEIAATLRRVVPADGRLAIADKWDPTVRRLSGRSGWTFPDRRFHPDGYPKSGLAAVRHLEEVREAGADHFVLTAATFWWLDHYPDLAAHLDRRYRLVWRDPHCVVYDLQPTPADA